MSDEERKNYHPDVEVRYVPLDMRQVHGEEGDMIDLIGLLKWIWESRKTIYKVIAAFFLLGLFVALFSVEEYTSEITVLPESQDGLSLGGLGGLAQQFGFSTQLQTPSEGISASLYPSIVHSNIFLRDLLDYEVQAPDGKGEILVKEYFNEHLKDSIFRTVISLPSAIINWLKNLFIGAEESPENTMSITKKKQIIIMTPQEWRVLRKLRDRITPTLDPETGQFTIGVKMQDANIAADVADEIVQNLSDFIVEKRTEKVSGDVEFIEERLSEAKDRFEETQQELATFNDQNRGQLTAMARTEEQLLQSNYNLDFNLYNSLAQRLEEARIKLQEETPVISIIDPAVVPDRRSEPQRILILIIFTFIGGIIGVGVVFVKIIGERLKE